jgi:hypothetical protein
MTDNELRELLSEYMTERRTQSNQSAEPPPGRAKIIHTIVERSNKASSFDIDIQTRIITRISPDLYDEFDFIFQNIREGDSSYKLGFVFDLRSLDRYRYAFRDLITGDEDRVIYSQCAHGSMSWILKMWRLNATTMRVMYITEAMTNSVNRLILEASGDVSSP